VFSIAIADDHPMFRRGTRDVLLEHFPGVLVGEAETGAEMIAMAGERKWDAFIMDINLPDKSGTDLLQDLLRVRPDTSVLVFSVHSESTYAVRMIRSGARAYLNKAIGSDQLIGAIETILHGRRYLTPQVAECLADSLKIPHALSNREFQILRLRE
jgi:DNA-binding NarL/FixJ family response regulator